jgi:hypothetical protein
VHSVTLVSQNGEFTGNVKVKGIVAGPYYVQVVSGGFWDLTLGS